MERFLISAVLFLLILSLIPTNTAGRTIVEASEYPIVFDSYGIPMVDYGGDIGIQYNPVTVSQYALEYYGTGNSSFYVLARWLAGHAEFHGNYSLWVYNFSWPYYGHTLHPPWYSGMAQGLGIEVMLKAWQSSGNQTYLRVANASLNGLAVPYSLGGVLHSFGNESWWYLEYASSTMDYHAYVLNGFIFALHGVYVYKTMVGGSVAENLWRRGMSALKSQLAAFDVPLSDDISDDAGWSYYALTPKQRAPPSYHLIHLGQLDWLYKTSHDYLFLYYLQRWTLGFSTRYRIHLLFDAESPEHMVKINLRSPIELWSEFNVTLRNVTVISEKSYGTDHSVILPTDSAGVYLLKIRVYTPSPFMETGNETVLYSKEAYVWLPTMGQTQTTSEILLIVAIALLGVTSALAISLVLRSANVEVTRKKSIG